MAGTSIHGKNGIVYLQGAAGAAQPLSQSADWQIDLDYDLAENNVMGDVWKGNNRGLNNYKGQLSGNLDTTSRLLLDAYLQTTPRAFYIYPDRAQPLNYYYGTIWPKLTVKGGIKGNATFSGGFTGDGAFGVN
jgi:hypothetical protein